MRKAYTAVALFYRVFNVLVDRIRAILAGGSANSRTGLAEWCVCVTSEKTAAHRRTVRDVFADHPSADCAFLTLAALHYSDRRGRYRSTDVSLCGFDLDLDFGFDFRLI
jgi:hypothetical protein